MCAGVWIGVEYHIPDDGGAVTVRTLESVDEDGAQVLGYAAFFVTVGQRPDAPSLLLGYIGSVDEIVHLTTDESRLRFSGKVVCVGHPRAMPTLAERHRFEPPGTNLVAPWQ